MSTSYTPNTKLGKPGVADRNWNLPLNANADLLDGLSPLGGLCVSPAEVPSASLNVRVARGNYQKRDGTVGSFAGAAAFAVAASQTSLLYLTDAGVLSVATGSYPATAHVRLATVTAGAGTITTVTDDRVVCSVIGTDALPYLPVAGGTMNEGANLSVGTTTGTRIGTATDPEASLLERVPGRSSRPIHAGLHHREQDRIGLHGDRRDNGLRRDRQRAGRLTLRSGERSERLRAAYENLRLSHRESRPGRQRNDQRPPVNRAGGLRPRLSLTSIRMTPQGEPMPGSFDFDPYESPLAGSAAAVGVFRYDPSRPADDRYALVPNVRCESIQYREGAEPPVARFRYLLDDTLAESDLPSQFEQLWPLDAAGPYVVRTDERLVVLASGPSGRGRVLFDGFVQAPRVDLTPTAQELTFLGVGAAIRCWDNPIGGRLQRHGDDPQTGAVVSVDLPTRFNPDGQPNCTPDGHDVNPNDPTQSYPVFLDQDLDRQPDPRTFWTLGKFVRYILGVHNDGAYRDQSRFLSTRRDVAGEGAADRLGVRQPGKHHRLYVRRYHYTRL